jgi:hypothetical protein
MGTFNISQEIADNHFSEAKIRRKIEDAFRNDFDVVLGRNDFAGNLWLRLSIKEKIFFFLPTFKIKMKIDIEKKGDSQLITGEGKIRPTANPLIGLPVWMLICTVALYPFLGSSTFLVAITTAWTALPSFIIFEIIIAIFQWRRAKNMFELSKDKLKFYLKKAA